MPRGGDTACAASLLSSRECASLTRTATGGVVVLLDNSTRREFVDASLGALRAHPSEALHTAPTDQLPAAVVNATVLLPSALHIAAALLAASHVVASGTPPPLLEAAAARRQPYRAVWRWCGRARCEPLPAHVASVAVDAWQRDGVAVAASDGDAVELAPFATSPFVDGAPGEWRREAACVSIDAGGRQLLVQAHPATGTLLWPLRWPAHFGQGAATPLYERDARYDASADDGAAAVRAARAAQHTLRRAAFVATLVQDNLFHSLFHAVPTREHAARVLQPPLGRVDFWPRYTRYWPSPVSTLGELRKGNVDPADEFRQLFPVPRWQGWEVIMRAIVHECTLARKNFDDPDEVHRLWRYLNLQHIICYTGLTNIYNRENFLNPLIE